MPRLSLKPNKFTPTGGGREQIAKALDHASDRRRLLNPEGFDLRFKITFLFRLAGNHGLEGAQLLLQF